MLCDAIQNLRSQIILQRLIALLRYIPRSSYYSARIITTLNTIFMHFTTYAAEALSQCCCLKK